MGRLLMILAPVGALALGILLLAGLAGMLVRLPWEPPCVMRTTSGEVAGSVADMRRYVREATAAVGATETRDETTARSRDGVRTSADGGDGPAAPASSEVRTALGSGPVLTCTIEPIAASAQPKDLPLGLTPRARELRAAVRDTFGAIPTGGYGPQKVLPGRAEGGEHSLGRAIDFFFRPYDDRDQQRAGWVLANWAVANAERFGIRTVIYSDQIWTARRSAQGWRDYRFRGPNADSPVNRHLDHVHIDVA